MKHRPWSVWVVAFALAMLFGCGGGNPAQGDGGPAEDARKGDSTPSDTAPPVDSTTLDSTAADAPIADSTPDTLAPDAPVGPTYTVGFTVMGLGPGSTLVALDNGADALTVGDGSFTFPTPLPNGSTYTVTISMQPANQTCIVMNGTGTIDNAAVAATVIDCSGTELIGGTLQGLAVGDAVVLQDNGADTLSLTANGTFHFATGLAPGSTYAVSVLTQPHSPSQSCVVANGTGRASAPVTTIQVTCTNTTGGGGDAGSVLVGGTVTGLAAGTVVLQDNGGNNLAVGSNGAFVFTEAVPTGSPYSVTILTQPSSPVQACVVAMGSGTAGMTNVTNVTVTCTTGSFTVGGTVTGLAPSSSVVLQDNGGDNVTVMSNGPFTFATDVASGNPYAVTVHTQPTNPPQVCNVSAGSGTVNGTNITNVVVNCSMNAHTLGGAVTGLAAGDSLELSATGGNDIFVSANGTFAFPTPLATGTMYAVTIAANPSAPVAETCTLTGATGTMGTADVTSVQVSCVINTYTVSGTVSGLLPAGSVVLFDNGGDMLLESADGAFTFPTAIASGNSYKVTIAVQPVYPPAAQTCLVTSGQGLVGNANIGGVTVTCVTDKFAVGGTIAGLAAGESVTLTDNGAFETAMFTGDGQPSQGFAFMKKLDSGSMYTVAVTSSPTAPVVQTCVVTSGGGPATVQNGDVTTVLITCTAPLFTITGTVVGLAAGDSIVADDNGNTSDDQTVVAPSNSFAFNTQVASGKTYDVTVTNPMSPIPQTCVVTGGSNGNGTGTIANADVSVTVTCTNVCVSPLPTACTTGADPETSASWVICSATCTSVWISAADSTGGTYHAAQICSILGYPTLTAYGATNGDVCGSAPGGSDSCSAPGSPPAGQDPTLVLGTDGNGIELAPPPPPPAGVMWECSDP
jgi:hypothetical protein